MARLTQLSLRPRTALDTSQNALKLELRWLARALAAASAAVPAMPDGDDCIYTCDQVTLKIRYEEDGFKGGLALLKANGVAVRGYLPLRTGCPPGPKCVIRS